LPKITVTGEQMANETQKQLVSLQEINGEHTPPNILAELVSEWRGKVKNA
jgi:hypothetical protein